MRIISTMTNDLLARRRGPGGRSFAAGATLDRLVRILIPHRRSNTGTPFSSLEAFVESGR
jgi:hypothetical protein